MLELAHLAEHVARLVALVVEQVDARGAPHVEGIERAIELQQLGAAVVGLHVARAPGS
jgi:hypothetical protein